MAITGIERYINEFGVTGMWLLYLGDLDISAPRRKKKHCLDTALDLMSDNQR